MEKKRVIDYLSQDEVKLLNQITNRSYENQGKISMLRKTGHTLDSFDLFILENEMRSQIKKDKKTLNDLKTKAALRKKVEDEIKRLKK